MSRFWPKYRYFTCSHDNNVQVCMNVEDHLDILVSSKYGKLYPILETLNDVYMAFHQQFRFYENDQFGFLTVDPFRAGTGMKVRQEETKLYAQRLVFNISLKFEVSVQSRI